MRVYKPFRLEVQLKPESIAILCNSRPTGRFANIARFPKCTRTSWGRHAFGLWDLRKCSQRINFFGVLGMIHLRGLVLSRGDSRNAF